MVTQVWYLEKSIILTQVAQPQEIKWMKEE